jgi:hypothetical protein
MPTIDIPDKICSHCGKTRWYLNLKTNQHTCYFRQLEGNKRYHLSTKGKEALKRAANKQSENLTDYYIVNNIRVLAYREGYKIDCKAVTPTQIERYRTFIKLKREINPKQFKTRKREKNIESKKSKQVTAN